MKNDNLVVFLDLVGRTIFAEKVTDSEVLKDRENDDNLLVVKNPVVVHIATGQGGQMSLQLLPVFFKEFLADKNDDVIFTFRKDNIAIADPATFDHKLYANYHNMFSPIQVQSADIGKEPKNNEVIDLFDEKK